MYLKAFMVWAPRMEKRKLLQIALYVCGSVGILYVFKGIHPGSVLIIHNFTRLLVVREYRGRTK
jgi:hypothetical protein